MNAAINVPNTRKDECMKAKSHSATPHLDDDENVKPMRETARQIGLTQVLLAMHWTTGSLASEENHQRLGRALDFLGATDEEIEK
jgi:hypothetical protein